MDKRVVFLIVLNILLRIHLLLIRPISMFPDSFRYLNAVEILSQNSLAFYEAPLYIFLQTTWYTIFTNQILLELFWKLTAFIFFIGFLALLPTLFKQLKLKTNEQIIVLILLLFSSWSLLLSGAIMQEFLLTFLVIAMFIVTNKLFENPKLKYILLTIILTTLIFATKQTSLFIMTGFALYGLIQKVSWKYKVGFLMILFVGFILYSPWLIKNQLAYGNAVIGNDGSASIFTWDKLIQFKDLGFYKEQTIKSYYYFWEIPRPDKVALAGAFSGGITSVMYAGYNLTALIGTLAVSLLILLGIVKYGWRYKKYLLLILPIASFTMIYFNYLNYFDFADTGRYTFPLHFIFYFFAAKYLESLKSINWKRFFYLLIILFVIISIVSAFGITYHIKGIDNQLMLAVPIVASSQAINYVSNDEFSTNVLDYYSKKPIKFYLKHNERDYSINCNSDIVFESKNLVISDTDVDLKICRQ